jgi:FkbM family methyltransferase
MDIPALLKDLSYCNYDLQTWINRRFRDENYEMIDRRVIDHIVSIDGLSWDLWGANDVCRVLDEYQFGDIGSEDVVLDLGACSGGVAIRAAKMGAKHVYAVEPLFTDILLKNVRLNNLQDTITVFSFGVGDGTPIHTRYGHIEKTIPTFTLPQIFEKMGEKPTFVKIDVEGAEWLIPPEDFTGIRRIEFEAHSEHISQFPQNPMLIEYIRKNWDVSETDCDLTCSHWLHAYPRKDTT